MPIIAVVGEWNQPTTVMVNYLKKLINVQQRASPIVDRIIKAKFGKKATYPDF